MRTCLYTLLAVISLTPVFLVQAQTCGNIITPANYSSEGSEEQIDPITDCTNPFERTEDLDTFKLNNQIVTNDAIYQVSATGTADYGFDDETYLNKFNTKYYKHSGNDYIRVQTDYAAPTEEAYDKAMFDYFNGNQVQIDLYSQIPRSFAPSNFFFVSTRPTVYKYDPVNGRKIIDVYNDLSAYYSYHIESPRPALLPGTYTVVLEHEDVFYPTYDKNLLQKFFSYVIPTAYASHSVKTVTFTLEGPVPEPKGASSVLFLPGIQASRLYLGDGQQVLNRMWEPSGNTDVSALGLSEQGSSLVDIRTNDIIDETSINLLGKNIYKSFIGFMDNLVSQEVIEDWTPFAYDWRYDVFDIAENGTKYLDGSVRNPVDEVLALAENSKSEKVTIIAHSNGGLLAKAIMIELKKRGKEDLVDKIIFIGTPQLGTPKAIGTVLHGYDQEALGGLIIDDGVARDVIRNLPGAYSLLPSEKYFEIVNEPVVYFDNSVTTASMRTAYGTTIDSLNSYNSFMDGTVDGTRNSVTQGEVNKPIKVNQNMFTDAQQKHKIQLDNWIPLDETKVFQVIGTGLPTMKAVEYREITESVCPPTAVSIFLCPKVKILKPYVRFTPYGDETVVSESAGYSYNSVFDKKYFDLDKAKEGIFNFKKTHSNITEASQVQEFIEQVIITGSSTAVDLFSTIQPTFNKIYDIEEMNSPVQISAKDTNGRVTGMVKEGGKWVKKEEIPDSTYLEFGGTKYLIVPASTKRTTTLIGEAFGGYTLTLSTLNGTSQSKRHEVVNATTTPTMVARYSKDADFSTMQTDYAGDGIFEYETTVDGLFVPPLPKVYTYTDLKNTINVLTIKKPLKDVLLGLAKEAEKFDAKSKQPIFSTLEKLTLKALEATIVLYQKQKLLTTVQVDELMVISRYLSK